MQLKRLRLEEKKSIRATFSMSEGTHNTLKNLISEHDITPKEFLDTILNVENIVKDVGNFYSQFFKEEERTIKKTIVCSKGAVEKINSIAKRSNLKRDSVFTVLVLLYSYLLGSAEEAENKNNKKALKIIEELENFLQKKEKEIDDIYDDQEHPVVVRFSYLIILVQNLVANIQDNLSENKPISYDM
jgi:hypothetical protein